MALPRESAFLPTIKCSSCGRDVEISMMGDHLCGGPTAELSPPPEANEAFDSQFSQPPFSKYGRTPPPVDTDAANRAFMHRGQLTPVSQPSGSRSASPVPGSGRLATGRTDDYSALSPGAIRRPGGYGGFGDPVKQEPDSSLSSSFGKQTGGGFMDRMNAIAPGPFDTNRSPSAPGFPTRKDSLDKYDGPSPEELARPLDRPSTSHSNTSGTSNPSNPFAVPRAPRKNGYGGFGAPGAGDELKPPASGLISRSETYPKPSPGLQSPARFPSASGTRTDRLRMSSSVSHERKMSMGPDTSRRPPPRTSLLANHKPKNSGSVDLAAEFGVGNPYHTPSDSASSGYSTFSHPSQTSSQTSPGRSPIDQGNAGDLPGRGLTGLEKPMETLTTRAPNDLPTPLRTPSPLVTPTYATSPGERVDPAIQPGTMDLEGRSYGRSAPTPRYGDAYYKEPEDMRPGDYADRPTRTSLARNNSPPTRSGLRDPLVLPSRGDCKACGLAIRGKSISSADGRLTGKYHKACFVCTTCSEPFSSTEFYVLGNKPYCEQHYHKLNGSLCGGCGRGIEGQYLEDEANIKYHPGCFRCLDCGRSLSDGYFEVDGRARIHHHQAHTRVDQVHARRMGWPVAYRGVRVRVRDPVGQSAWADPRTGRHTAAVSAPVGPASGLAPG
ncbi:GTPase Ryh1 [Purpureocillium lavendulum]|uniref:GTPase Ryh1 n=1 Tax=Purpureocillium lavendulum TaxID=1247861 RepID=A0AB34FXP6_9HYPO|nr:GTPase Ryh1 [Purpureocillium lavendulum]